FHEMCADGIDLTYEQVLENLRLRDGNDQCQWAPLLEPGQAFIIDTSKLRIDEVVEVLLEHVKEACNH
ncbi:MAG: (d)CMP kinase, partial [Planctomycetes bacterium]|nr:(d)CMP kinase [Planctomycetota bacterium]